MAIVSSAPTFSAAAAVPSANLVSVKSVDRFIAYLDDTITYHIAVTNLGTLQADNVVITDPVPNGTVLVPGSLTVSVPYTPLPGGAISLDGPIVPGVTVTMSFRVLVTAIPNPNPIRNVAKVDYTYTVGSQEPVAVTSASNAAVTAVFANNYRQEISDLIESVALQEAALAAILNAEGAKIQRFAAMPGVSSDMLVCLNKSVSDMTDAVAMLEAILKQKLSAVNCQINGNCM